jgi:hypothetical protein
VFVAFTGVIDAMDTAFKRQVALACFNRNHAHVLSLCYNDIPKVPATIFSASKRAWEREFRRHRTVVKDHARRVAETESLWAEMSDHVSLFLAADGYFTSACTSNVRM